MITDRAKQALRTEAIEHIWRVSYVSSAGSGSLDVESGTVTFDEGWTPFVQANLSCKVPEDQEVLDALDGRIGCRLMIEMGYRFPDTTEETVTLNLGLRDRVVSRPQNVMTLSAASDEALVMDAMYHPDWFNGAQPPKTGAREALIWLVQTALNGTQQFDARVPLETDPEVLTELALMADTGFWDAISTVCDPTDVWCRDDGTRKWVLSQRPDIAGLSAHQLAVGPVGNIIDSETLLSRETWSNGIRLLHEWEDSLGVQHRRGTTALATSGPMSVANAGMKMLKIQKDTPISVAGIRASARNLLKRQISRGRAMSLMTPSPYWLRPGDTVTAQLPTGPQERHLVASTAFRFPSGECSIRTRLPANVEITGE